MELVLGNVGVNASLASVEVVSKPVLLEESSGEEDNVYGALVVFVILVVLVVLYVALKPRWMSYG